MDFSKYEFRSSQVSKISGGSLEPVGDIKIEIKDLLEEKLTGINKNGNKTKWTETKIKRLETLQEKEKSPLVCNGFILPKTMANELIKLHREEKYKRNFIFTNQYLQKGIKQEEEAITLYQIYKNIIGQRTLFTKNKKRLHNGWVSGEPDLGPYGVPLLEWKEGFDTKCSWNLQTFPLADEPLDQTYEDQNQSYMWLTGAEKWTTAYCLVNATEHQVNNEKLKWYYALEMPNDADDKYWEDYQQKKREVELMMIYDYERFVDLYPGHDMEISKDEWFGEGYDIPVEDRVIEKFSERDDSRIKHFKDRIGISREFMSKL